jgi:ribonuclease D
LASISLLSAEIPDDFQCPAILDKLTPSQRDALRQMQQKARDIAEKLGVEAALLASRRELTRWLQEGPPSWLDGWRGQFLDGEILLESQPI